LTPIVNLARSYAIESGIAEPGTPERLRLAAEMGRIDEETHTGLAQALALLWRVRLERHARCVETGSRPDDLVEARGLSPRTRAELKEALLIVRRAQRALRHEHRLTLS
jgi:signal-transduction protein with cAMP-binding, CBS, and nucleotidyltransferase domain